MATEPSPRPRQNLLKALPALHDVLKEEIAGIVKKRTATKEDIEHDVYQRTADSIMQGVATGFFYMDEDPNDLEIVSRPHPFRVVIGGSGDARIAAKCSVVFKNVNIPKDLLLTVGHQLAEDLMGVGFHGIVSDTGTEVALTVSLQVAPAKKSLSNRAQQPAATDQITASRSASPSRFSIRRSTIDSSSDAAKQLARSASLEISAMKDMRQAVAAAPPPIPANQPASALSAIVEPELTPDDDNTRVKFTAVCASKLSGLTDVLQASQFSEVVKLLASRPNDIVSACNFIDSEAYVAAEFYSSYPDEAWVFAIHVQTEEQAVTVALDESREVGVFEKFSGRIGRIIVLPDDDVLYIDSIVVDTNWVNNMTYAQVKGKAVEAVAKYLTAEKEKRPLHIRLPNDKLELRNLDKIQRLKKFRAQRAVVQSAVTTAMAANGRPPSPANVKIPSRPLAAAASPVQKFESLDIPPPEPVSPREGDAAVQNPLNWSPRFGSVSGKAKPTSPRPRSNTSPSPRLAEAAAAATQNK